MAVIDCDQHLFEPVGLWERYVDPADREVALRLEPDELGNTWLRWGDLDLCPALVQIPGDTEAIGAQMRRLRAGLPPEHSYAEVTPPDFEQPAARLRFLDEHGIDAAVLFANYGLVWERTLSSDLRSLRANLGAWNRFAGEVAGEGGGRLLPVGHLSLCDREWVEHQLEQLANAGVRAAMIAPALVDGKRLSHPDIDWVWSSFVHHGVTPVFHVADQPRVFDDAWVEDDPDTVNPVLGSVFLSAPAQLALADLAVHGVFERHPELRIGVIELSAIWVPMFLLTLDGGFDFHAKFNGGPLTELPMKPSEYIRRQVRVAAFAYESPDRLARRAGDLFMFCSDYPHSEGTATPLEDYRRMCPATPDPASAPGLFGGNAAWLLGL